MNAHTSRHPHRLIETDLGDGRERLLRVVAPHFVAGAVWQPTVHGWKCTDAAPILRWMVGKPPQQVAAYLRRKGWEYQWL